MNEASQYLVKVTHWPRVLAYLFAAAILFAVDEKLPAAFVLVYPHFVNGVLRRADCDDRTVKMSMLLDALIVGQLVAAIDFHLLGSVALTTLLVISMLVIAGPWSLAVGLPLLGMSAVSRHLAGTSAGPPASMQAVDLVSLISLIGYVTVVSYLVYRETRRLHYRRREESWVRRNLETQQLRLKPFLAPQLMTREMDNVSATYRKRLTVFFSDIEGFTRLMDEGDESIIAARLNEYLEEMTRIAEVHGGTIDKFMGDGVMIFFGDPVSQGAEGDAFACVSMALEMRASTQRLAERWRGFGRGAPIHIRMGIHTGYCLVGNFGSVARMDYTALGSAVNLASRLENSACRDEILISEDTFKLVSPWVQVSGRGMIKVKGLARPVGTYSVLAATARDSSRHRPGNVRLLS